MHNDHGRLDEPRAVARAGESSADAELIRRAATKFREKVRPVATTTYDVWKDEESVRMLEHQWRKFCATVGLAPVPDIRAAIDRVARKQAAKRGWRHRFRAALRGLVDFFKAHP